MIIWLIGKSGAGKTTLGKALYEKLKPEHSNFVFLDGDILRDVWRDQLGHTIEAREKNAARISHLCKMMDDQGIHAVASVLSIFPEWQQWNRDNFSDYYEIYLDVPQSVLEERDTKGLYKMAREGKMENVVGVDIPFPTPPNADLVLDEPIVLAPIEDTLAHILEHLPAM